MTFDLQQELSSLQNCECGRVHIPAIKKIVVESGAQNRTASVLRDAGFQPKLCVAADKNTLKASGNIMQQLHEGGFDCTLVRYDDLQCSDMTDVRELLAKGASCDAYLSVGTGSLNDICRYAAALSKKPFAIFATAPSMDGFASVMAPIIENGFKRTYPAVAPEVIIADSDILAASPVELKAAGLGDLLGKYTALCDWEITRIMTGEYYCRRISDLTRRAVDRAVLLAPGIRGGSRESAQSLMHALVLSGLAMLMTGSTRPASGAEHHIAHFFEMQYMLLQKPQVFHGKKVGIACAMVCDVYNRLARLERITARPSIIDEKVIRRVYGPLSDECMKENTPDPLADISPERLEELWPQLREHLKQVPSGSEIRRLLALSGGAPDYRAAGIPEQLARDGIRYGYYARFRLTMMRLLSMINIDDEVYRLEI